MLSLIALLGGIGLLFGAFGRWGRNLGWHGREQATLSFRAPGDVALTPAQRATAWFFFVMAALFLIQTLVGAASQHYRAEIDGFFGFDLAKLFPYNLMRTWHVQLALFWVATSFVAAGIFLAPMIARREPRHQGKLAFALLGALAVVVFGTLIGSYLGVHGVLKDAASNWFGLQGFEYLDLARLWQVLLSIGLFVWVFMLWRVLRRRLATEHPGNMPWLFFLAACAIPAFYAVGLIARTGDNFTTTEFWRFWVVHLWVEDFLELFTTVMVAYMFVLLGVVRERIALTVVFLDIVLYSVGGVVGTMHHLYFSGEPAEHMALGAFFSAAEVLPLTFLTVEAWSFLQLGAAQESRSQTPFPHRWAVMFLVAVGFWNFLGAGIFGFLINLPIVSYYEIGTALTANHGHAAMMGVYGMLALGLALFCLRYLIPADRWPEKWARISFWSTNIGLAWMCFATLLPLGILQLYKSVNEGYFEARELKFLTNDTNALLEWLRLPGDIVFIVGGAIPALYIAYLGIRHTVKRVTLDEPDDILFTEIAPARGRRADRRRRGDRGEAEMNPEVVLAAGYAGLLRDRRVRAGVAVRAHAPPLAALPHRGLHLRRGTRPLGVPGRRAPLAARVRPRAPAGALPRQGPHLQRMPAQGGLHRLRPRPRDRQAPGPVAAFRSRPLPPHDLAAHGRARRADPRRRSGTPPRPCRTGGAGRHPPRLHCHRPVSARRFPGSAERIPMGGGRAKWQRSPADGPA